MKLSKGFTLIELIVVIAVFLFIIGAAIGIFISVVSNQRRILSEQQLLNQISYAEEYMSKALRMAKTAGDADAGCIPKGYIYLLTRYDINLGIYKGIKFINQSDNSACQEFFLDNATDPARPVLKELKNNTNDLKAVALTSNNLQINSIRFSVNGSNGSMFTSDSCQTNTQCGASNIDGVQPRVTIFLNVSIPGDNQGASRTIQTTVSRRNLNVQQ